MAKLETGQMSWLLVSLLVALILATTEVLVVSLQVLLLIFAGILFGLFLNGLSRLVSRYSPMGYRAAYVVVVVVLVLAAAGGGYWSGSRMVQQASKLSSQIRSTLDQLDRHLQASSWGAYYSDLLAQLEHTVDDGSGVLPQIMTVAGTLMWTATAAFVIFFVGLYVAYDPRLYEEGILKLVPLDRRARAAEVLQTLRSTLGWWIVGRFISMTIVGVATAAALWWLGVPLPLTLGVLAALLTFIPNIGPVLAALPQALLAFQVGTSTVLYVLLFNVVLETVESYLITPVVQQYEVTLPPAVTIFAQLMMGVVLGALGVVMAAPLVAVAMVLVQMLYIQDRLGDPNPGRLAEGS